jgi:hypothetical protein
MDDEAPVLVAQQVQASWSSQHPSATSNGSRDNGWNVYKDEIYKVYMEQNNTLKATMRMIESQGGPKAR